MARGGAYQLTALLPAAPPPAGDLHAALRKWPDGPGNPFALPATHFARLVVLDRLASRRPGATAVVLDPPRLLLAADVDGAPEAWLQDLVRNAPGAVADVFGSCDGWPGPDPARFASWVRRYEIRPNLLFATYAATVADVRAGIDARDRLTAFAIRAQGLNPAALRAAWNEQFG